MASSFGKMRRWLLPENGELARAPRQVQPEIVVHYWDGAAPEGRGLRDISETGVYILTAEQWYPGTIIRIILQGHRATAKADGTAVPAPSICVPAQVVRQGDDGVAMEFVFRNKQEKEKFREFLASFPNPAPGAPAAEVKADRKGQALIEFALIMPLVFLLAVNVVNFGGFLFAWITVAGAARDGVQYMVMSSASEGSSTPATTNQITTLVTNDVTSLLNRSSVVVATCTNNTTSSNSCTTLSDPEAPAYTLAAVDVTYTYNPFIPLFSFPRLGISATLPSTAIHRKAVMRMLQ
jgi:Flp pilus assembly protein TadG